MFWKNHKLITTLSLKHILVMLLLFSGCQPLTVKQTQKMNARLRQQLHNTTSIRFHGECVSSITPEVSVTIQKTGIRIHSFNGPLFTASGSPKQIRRLVRLDLIKKLEAVPVYRIEP